MKGLLIFILIPLVLSTSRIEKRISDAILSEFSHEPWRTDSIVLHWDFSVPRDVLSNVTLAHRWSIRMDWNRDVHVRMDALRKEYAMYMDQMRWCREGYAACRRKCAKESQFNWETDAVLTTGSFLYDCFHGKCNSCEGIVMDERVREYIELRDMNVPKYDRMIIGKWKW